MYEIMTGEEKDPESIKFKKEINEAYKELIERCWNQEAEKRPTFDEILIELKTNPLFITNEINKEEYFNYIKSIEESPISFDQTKRKRKIDDFIESKSHTFHKSDYDLKSRGPIYSGEDLDLSKYELGDSAYESDKMSEFHVYEISEKKYIEDEKCDNDNTNIKEEKDINEEDKKDNFEEEKKDNFEEEKKIILKKIKKNNFEEDKKDNDDEEKDDINIKKDNNDEKNDNDEEDISEYDEKNDNDEEDISEYDENNDSYIQYYGQMYTKKINCFYRNEMINFNNKLKIISQINHPAILNFIGFSTVNFNNENKPIILTEYCYYIH